MLLAVNVGNTETKLGVFRERELAFSRRISSHPERTADELALLFGGFLEQQELSFSRQITGVSISSVVPSMTQALRDMTERYFHFEPVVVGPGVKTGMAVLTDNPREVGADRIVNAIAAFEEYGGPCIVVDFGTATTYDIVSEKGEFVGGVIAPGLEVSAVGLSRVADRLPRVEISAPKSVVGKNTVEAIQAGLVFGTAAEVDGVVERIQKELGPSKVIATGGLAGVVMPHCHSIDHHDAWLTLQGLRLIFERNTDRDD
ncbi:MAG: type III pantothenate kinase [Actinomycetota bacterium]